MNEILITLTRFSNRNNTTVIEYLKDNHIMILNDKSLKS